MLEHLTKAGFQINGVDDGGEEHVVRSIEQAIEIITSVDDSTLFVSHDSLRRKKYPDQVRHLPLFLVLGNGPGELVCDWPRADYLDATLDAWSASEERLHERPLSAL